MPKISVIIPAFNSVAVLERAVASVLAQTKPVDEILIYDDASVDGTADVMARLSAAQPKIQAVAGTENKGAGHARNHLLGLAKGNYFAFLDADDEWAPDKIAMQMADIERSAAQISITAHEIKKDGLVIGHRVPPQEIGFRKMLVSNWMATSSVIVSAELSGARRMPEIRRRQDYGYWLKLFQNNPNLKVVVNQNILMTYHRGSASLSSSPVKNLKGNYRMFRDVVGFGILGAAFFTLCNAVFRILRK